MPPRDAAATAAVTQLRRVQSRVPFLPVSALIRLGDAVEHALERDRLHPRDVDIVIRAAEEP